MKFVKRINTEDIKDINAEEILKKIIEVFDDHEGSAQDFAYAVCEILETTFGTIEDFE